MDHARATAAAVMAAGFPADPRLQHQQATQHVPVQVPPVMHAGVQAPAPQLAAQPTQRKMSDVLDQTDPGTYVSLSRAELKAAMDLHIRIMGTRPQPEAEPSPEQLGALRTKLRAGEPPAVDFGIWGSFDRRHARDRQSMALVWIEGVVCNHAAS